MSEDLARKSRTLANRMRKKGQYSAFDIYAELQKAFSAGYKEGHDDQMRARILDAQARRKP